MKEPEYTAEQREAIDAATLAISKARTRLIIHTGEYCGYIAMALKEIPRFDISMGATDGKHLFFNPHYINSISTDEIIGFIREECMHIELMHPIRLGDRDRKIANVAMDQAIFNIIEDEDFFVPEYVNFDKKYEGMAWEEIYAHMQRNPKPDPDGSPNSDASPDGEEPPETDDSTSDDTGGDDNDESSTDDATDGSDDTGDTGGDADDADPSNPHTRPLDGLDGQRGGVVEALNPDGSKLSKAEQGKAEQDLAVTITQAIQQARVAGTGAVKADRWIKSRFEPNVPWTQELREWFADMGIEMHDYTWIQPDPAVRHLGLYLPDVETRQGAEIAIGIDVSSSVTEAELRQIATETQSILDEYDPAMVHVYYCHSYVCKIERYGKGERLDFRIPETGGTLFQPVLDAIEEDGLTNTIKGLIYFTDLYGPDPIESTYPVLWACTSDNTRVPSFGRKIKVKIKETVYV